MTARLLLLLLLLRIVLFQTRRRIYVLILRLEKTEGLRQMMLPPLIKDQITFQIAHTFFFGRCLAFAAAIAAA